MRRMRSENEPDFNSTIFLLQYTYYVLPTGDFDDDAGLS